MTVKTLQEAACAALNAQTACNINAVAQDFAQATQLLWKEVHAGRGTGTDWVNKHPITVLFATQISHLSGGSCLHDQYDRAHKACTKLAGYDYHDNHCVICLHEGYHYGREHVMEGQE